MLGKKYIYIKCFFFSPDYLRLLHLQRLLARSDLHPPALRVRRLHPGAKGRHQPGVHWRLPLHRTCGLHVHPDLRHAGCDPVLSHAVPQVTSHLLSASFFITVFEIHDVERLFIIS